MRQLTFSRVLPILQFVSAVVLLEWDRVTPRPARLDTLFASTPRLVCLGINAPASLIKLLAVQLLPIYQVNQPPISVFGIGAETLIFMVCIIVLWNLVGRVLDNRRLPRVPKRMTAVDLLRNLLLVLVALVLFVLGLVPLRDPGQLNNPTGSVAKGILTLVWAALLLGYAGLHLIRGIRHRYPESAGSSLTCPK